MEAGLVQAVPRKSLTGFGAVIPNTGGLCASQAIPIPSNSSRSISMASISSEGSTESPMVEQEEIAALTHDVRTFKEALGKLKKVFSLEKERSDSLRVAAHERLSEVLRILRGVLEKYSALQSSELLSAAGTLIQHAKGYNYENEKADPREFFEYIDQLALAFSSRVSEYLMGDLDMHIPASLSTSVSNKTKSCENIVSDLEVQEVKEQKRAGLVSPQQLDGVLLNLERGVEHALHRAKLWSKYAKDIMMYVEKRAHMELEFTKNMIKLSRTIRPLLKEEDYLPLQSIYCAAIDHDVDNSNSSQATCSLLLGNKFIEPLSARRNEHERIRKHLKETWQKELKKMHEAISGLRKCRALYIQRQKEWEEAREAAYHAGAPAVLSEEGWPRTTELMDQSMLDKRRRLEDDALQKAIEAETTYKSAVTEANEHHLQLQKVKADILHQVHELIMQCDQTMKAVTVSYFQLQHTLSTPIPIQFQTLCESSKLYEPGLQYVEFVKQLPTGAPKDPLKPPFTFEPFSEVSVVMQERKSTGSIDSEELCQGKDKPGGDMSIKTWNTVVHGGLGSDTDSISSSHSNKSQDTSPTASPMMPDRKLINISSGDELENEQDNDTNFIAFEPALRQCMSKAAVTHNFRKLKTPSRCRECDTYVYFQGADCSECGLACHKKCLETLAIQCGHKRLPRKMTTFGVDLIQHLSETSTQVPYIVCKCVNEIDERGKFLKGIYRVSGVKSKVEKLCQAFENGADLVDLTDIHPNVIANVLKLYLRQLPEPLLTFRLYTDFVRIAKDFPSNISYNNKEPVEELKAVAEKLPKHHYATLAVLMRHLKRVAEESETNNMPASNLGIVFGPTLLRTAEGSASLSSLVDTVHQTRAVELTIIHANDIFGSVDFLSIGDHKLKIEGHPISRSSSSTTSFKAKKVNKDPEVAPQSLAFDDLQEEVSSAIPSNKDTSSLHKISISALTEVEQFSGTSDDELPDFLLPDNSYKKISTSVQGMAHSTEKILKVSLRDYQGLEGFSVSMSSAHQTSEKEHRRLRKSISDVISRPRVDPPEGNVLQTSQSSETADTYSHRRTSPSKDPSLKDGNVNLEKRLSIKEHAGDVLPSSIVGGNEKKKSLSVTSVLTKKEVMKLTGLQIDSSENKTELVDESETRSIQEHQNKEGNEALGTESVKELHNMELCSNDLAENQCDMLRKSHPKTDQMCMVRIRAESSADSDYSFESHASSSAESRSPRDYENEEGKVAFPSNFFNKRQSVTAYEVKPPDSYETEEVERNATFKTSCQFSSEVFEKQSYQQLQETRTSGVAESLSEKSTNHHHSSTDYKAKRNDAGPLSGQGESSWIVSNEQVGTQCLASLGSQRRPQDVSQSLVVMSSQKRPSQYNEEKQIAVVKSQYLGFESNKLKVQVPPKAVTVSSTLTKSTSNDEVVRHTVKQQHPLVYSQELQQGSGQKLILQSESGRRTVCGERVEESTCSTSLSSKGGRASTSDRVPASALRTCVVHRTVNMSQAARITNLTQAQNLIGSAPLMEVQPQECCSVFVAAQKKKGSKRE